MRRSLCLSLVLLLAGPVLGTTAREIPHYKSGLTDAASNNVFEVAIAAGQRIGGRVRWAILCTDGVDYQVREGVLEYTAVNKAGAITTQIQWSSSTPSVSAGTLATSWSTTAGASKITIAVTPNSSLVPTTLAVDLVIEQRSTTNVTLL